MERLLSVLEKRRVLLGLVSGCLLLTVGLGGWWIAAGDDVPAFVEPATIIAGATLTGVMVFGARELGVSETTHAAPPVDQVLPAMTSVDEKASFSALSVTKVVDLSRNHSRAGHSDLPEGGALGTTVITDMYLVQRRSHLAEAGVFLYSTSGWINGQSLSHPGDSTWERVETDHMRRSYELRTRLPHLDVGGKALVVNRLEYVGAFETADGEVLETHIDRPTDALTWFLRFSRDRRCRTCSGAVKVGRGKWEVDRETGPIVLEDGEFVVWKLSGDLLSLNNTYRLKWTWPPSSSFEIG